MIGRLFIDIHLRKFSNIRIRKCFMNGAIPLQMSSRAFHALTNSPVYYRHNVGEHAQGDAQRFKVVGVLWRY